MVPEFLSSENMYLDRTQKYDRMVAEKEGGAGKANDSEQPLTCMIYFFASQMTRHLQQQNAEIREGNGNSKPPIHRLDALLSRIGVHAAFSPHVTRFETFPVEIPPTAGNPKRKDDEPSKESMHDTMLLVKFRSKRAREEWIATPEWMEFMEKTDKEGVFRRIPHVRCARSLKGLRDPVEILMA